MTVRSLFVGLSGLTAMGHDIDVISNNIANVNTVGFRAGRAAFDDIFYQTLFSGVGASGNQGGINPRQIGTGVRLASVDTLFTQGSSQSTGRLLDMSIEGNGFFVLVDKTNTKYLTRAGNFSLDDQGYIVDPGTGYRLIGKVASEDGVILEDQAEAPLQIDFSRNAPARSTGNVIASGNFDARIGNPTSDSEVSTAQKTTNLLGMFNEGGTPLGLINGDVIRFETGFLDLNDPPDHIQSPINLSSIDSGKGEGVLMTITSTTTMQDLQQAFNDFFSTTVRQISPGMASGIEVGFDNSTGEFQFTNTGSNSLNGVRIGLTPRGESGKPPEEANRLLGNLFVNQGDPDFTRTLNVGAEEVVRTEVIRRADSTSSIDVYDSLGNAYTVSMGLAVDTETPAATRETTVGDLQDSQGRFLIPGGVVPPKPEFSEPILDAATNTAVFTATQISNIVATQGIYSFEDGSGNLVAIRLSDGAISFNGNDFASPILSDGTIDQEFLDNGLDVTGDSMLNIPSAVNQGGGLLGDEGFTQSTTMEDLRRNIENRINAAIQQVSSHLSDIDPTTIIRLNVPAGGFTAPANLPAKPITVELTEDGSFTFRSNFGNLGSVASTNSTYLTNIANSQARGDVGAWPKDEGLGLVFDLAAKTRSVRVSTVDPGDLPATTDDFADGRVDNNYNDGGGITGFIQSVDPFGDINDVFQIGNTDYSVLDNNGDFVIGNPAALAGIQDSGVHLVALSSGAYATSDDLDDANFSGYQAFSQEATALRALFNQRGYGIAGNFDGAPGVDRTTGVPIGIVANADDPLPFEINTIHRDGQNRNMVNFQVAVPNDYRTVPNKTTGTLFFNTRGRFQSYGNAAQTPTLSFDPDNNDPLQGGVPTVQFALDLKNITYFSATSTAQMQSQDGRPMGTLDNVSITNNGEILGIFTNGDTQYLGQILLGSVNNEGGLLQVGSTLFVKGPNSGDIKTNQAGVDGLGVVKSGSLELSNVDLAQEFTRLIVAQRAYQANSRVITTGDQILTELVNLKR